MAFVRTMAQLVTSCRRRADKKDGEDGQIDSDTWKEMISELYGELHGAVSLAGARYFETEATIAATGASSYALPTDHLSTIGVDRVLDAAGRRQDLAELMVQEHAVFGGQTGPAYLWAFTGAYIALYPTPASGTYKHLYVPQPADYSSVGNGTEIDLINNDGLKFVVWGVAAIALHTGDANQVRAVKERDDAKLQLVEWATRRALTMPKRRVVNCIEQLGGDGRFVSPADWRFR